MRARRAAIASASFFCASLTLIDSKLAAASPAGIRFNLGWKYGTLHLAGGSSPPMLHKLISIAAWATLAFIIFATLSPVHFRPELTATEPALVVAFERVGAFAVLGLRVVTGSFV